MYELDAILTQTINLIAGANPPIDFLIIWVSPFLALLIVGQWWRKVDRQRTRHVLVAARLSCVFGFVFNQAIQLLLHPVSLYDLSVTHLLMGPSMDPSFPSDHATATIALVATFLLHGMQSHR